MLQKAELLVMWACYYLMRVSSFECLDCFNFGHFSSKAPHTIIPHLSHLFSLPLVPDDQSLKVFRAEANLGLRRFSDALTDLDYLCCLRPSWTEVRTERSQPDAVCLCCLCGSFVRTTSWSVVGNINSATFIAFHCTLVWESRIWTCTPSHCRLGFVTCMLRHNRNCRKKVLPHFIICLTMSTWYIWSNSPAFIDVMSFTMLCKQLLMS